MTRLLIVAGLLASLWGMRAGAQTGESDAWFNIGMGPILYHLPAGAEWTRVDEETGAMTVVRMIMGDDGAFQRAEYITLDREDLPDQFEGWLPGEFALAYLEWEVENIEVEGIGTGLFELERLDIGQTDRAGRPWFFLKNTKQTDRAKSGFSTEVQELWVTYLSDARATGRIHKIFIGVLCMAQYCPPDQMDPAPLRRALDISERMTSENVEALLEARAGKAALALSEKLLRSHPYSTRLQILAARSELRIGRDHALEGRHHTALEFFDRARARLVRQQRAGRGGPEVTRWRARAEYRRALALENLWRMPEAFEAYRAAQAADPQHPGSLAGQAHAAFLVGNYRLAEDLFDKALALDPDHGAALNDLAWMRVAAGLPEYRDPDEAADLVFDAMVDEPRAAYLNTRAAAMFRRGRIGKALQTYVRAVRLDPAYAARVVNDLVRAGCADPGQAAPDDVLPDYMLGICLDAGVLPFYLAENLRRIDYLARHDPATARRHLEVLEVEYPDHPETLKRRAASRTWGPDAEAEAPQD